MPVKHHWAGPLAFPRQFRIQILFFYFFLETLQILWLKMDLKIFTEPKLMNQIFPESLEFYLLK